MLSVQVLLGLSQAGRMIVAPAPSPEVKIDGEIRQAADAETPHDNARQLKAGSYVLSISWQRARSTLIHLTIDSLLSIAAALLEENDIIVIV